MGSSWSALRPEVQVATGRLRGRTGTTPAGTKYHAFLGVPYAKPPVGELRFKAPQPAEPWTGVRDAGAVGNICPQQILAMTPGTLSVKDIIGLLKIAPSLIQRFRTQKRQSEDCLFLNVYTPAAAMPSEELEVAKEAAPGSPSGATGTTDETPKEAPVETPGEAVSPKSPLRPVLFWIHGGGFQMCDGNPDIMAPELFLDRNIVVVTMNYRLGPLGFLALGTADVPGNAGLKDQVMALQWTRDNIRAFGGDPDNITVYGVSAGGGSAHFHHISPLSKGLFHGAIASSGTAMMSWAVCSRSLDCARQLAKELDLEADTPEELAKALRSVSAIRLTKAATKMPRVFTCVADELMFMPVVEPDLPGAFLAENPETIVREGRYNPVPLIAGVCSAEGLVWLMFANDNDEKRMMAQTNEFPQYFLPPDLGQQLSPEKREECYKEVLQEYTGGKPFSKETMAEIVEIAGDVMFMLKMPVLGRLHAAAGRSPVYLYRFNFEGRLNFLKWMLQAKLKSSARPVIGASHGDDIWYTADMRLFPLPTLAVDSREMVLRRRMMKLWTNFMETKDPTPAGRDEDLLPVRWQPCTADSHPYLDIDDELQMRTDNLYARQEFWNNLYLKYLGKPLVDDGAANAR